MSGKFVYVQIGLEICAAVVLYLHLRLLSGPWKSHERVNAVPILAQSTETACSRWWDVPTLYINLERAEQRRSEMEEDVRQLKPISRFLRLNASDTQDNATFGLAQRTRTYLSESETAVLLSHLRAIETGMDRFTNSKYLLVLEDDVSFSTIPRWAGSLGDLLDEATREISDWEILNIACSNWRDSSAFSAGFFFQRYRFKNFRSFKGPEFFGAVAYAVRRSPGVSSLISTFKRWRALSELSEGANVTAMYLAGLNNSELAALHSDPLPDMPTMMAALRKEEGELLVSLFSEPSDWTLYRRLRSYVTTVPLLVPNNTGLASQVHDEKTENHLAQAAVSLAFWATQPAACSGVDSSGLFQPLYGASPEADVEDRSEDSHAEPPADSEPGQAARAPPSPGGGGWTFERSSGQDLEIS